MTTCPLPVFDSLWWCVCVCIKPQIIPPSPLIFAILNGGSKRWFGGSGITTWKTLEKYSPSDLAGGGGGTLGVRFGLAHFSNGLMVF